MSNRSTAYITVLVCAVVTVVSIGKYVEVKDAYKKAEKEKLDYCEKYYETKNNLEDLQSDTQWQDSVIRFLQTDNQILSSFLAEMENEKHN